MTVRKLFRGDPCWRRLDTGVAAVDGDDARLRRSNIGKGKERIGIYRAG